ncbi:maltodextrin glucosidase [Neiella sp. HB171785]|uniref:Maltodextrin glucosidase n=1 Tax=Neiella litorisoli TaxID=2771431 RepID=A0A8J6QHV1_9GAMM|nr:maltodextrin glucosidase [Neiella litorisoli]MBD1390065.1 maltodextrin glucosidase [Neiella litorisoli]
MVAAAYPTPPYPHNMHHYPLPEYRHSTDGQLVVRLRFAKDAVVDQLWLRTEPDNEEQLTAMRQEGADEHWQWWTAQMPLSDHELTFFYCFKAICGDRQLWLDATGMNPRAPKREHQFRWLIANHPPQWLRHQVFYQVFPERFRNGDPQLNVQSNAYLYHGEVASRAMSWGEAILAEGDQAAFYGGDLIGVQQGIDYIQQLGVTAIYLNPVFSSPSSHKYDTEDYFNVDRHFGGNAALADLCQQIHQRQMKIVLDAVFNHTSESHPWFDRWQQHDSAGAYASPNAATRDYYYFYDPANADSYHCWKGAKTLPTLDWSNPQVQDYFCNPQSGVIQHWLQPPYCIDGWRLDVIHMLGDGPGAKNNAARMRQIRQAVKQTNSEAMVLGEHFFEASRWLQGDQEDGAMNYFGFATPVRAFLAHQDVAYQPCRIRAEDFDDWLAEARHGIAFEHQLAQFNLLGSHDTARFFTLVNEHLPTMKQAVLLLMSYIGVPSIYYGDEIGLTGHNDPYCRTCFNWDETSWHQELKHWYQQTIALRQQYSALQCGTYATLYAKADLFVFARFIAKQMLIVAINRSDEQQAIELDLSCWSTPISNAQTLLGQAQLTLSTQQLSVHGYEASVILCQ